MRLEIAVTSAAGAGTSAAEGADTVELCSSLELGGITPSQGLLEASLEHVDGRLEVHALVRPRPGDFHYSASDVDTMVHEIKHLLRQGAAGVVVGVLTAEQEVDVPVVRRLLESAKETNPEARLTFTGPSISPATPWLRWTSSWIWGSPGSSPPDMNQRQGKACTHWRGSLNGPPAPWKSWPGEGSSLPTSRPCTPPASQQCISPRNGPCPRSRTLPSPSAAGTVPILRPTR